MTIIKGPASAALEKRISESGLRGAELSADGGAACITFADYMEACLYDPESGYYRVGGARVGKSGDFYTVSGVGDLMARAIAGAALQWRSETARDDLASLLLAEWGAGTGRLSAQLAAVLSEVEDGSGIPFRQLLVEDHKGHQNEIAETYKMLHGGPPPVVRSSDEVWEQAERLLAGPLLLIANELLDAFPVHRVTRKDGVIAELGVAGDAENGFRYVRLPLTDKRIRMEMDRGELTLEEGDIREVCLAAGDWIRRLASAMGHGRVLIIDYGDCGEELSAPYRSEGTFMTYSNHLASDEPFHRPGGRDLTAHVNFTAVRRCAEEAGFTTLYYGTQKEFLLEQGMLQLLVEHDGANPFSYESRRNRAIRQLLLGDNMSESFKVLLLEKRESSE